MNLPKGVIAMMASPDAVKITEYRTPEGKLISEDIEYNPKKAVVLIT